MPWSLSSTVPVGRITGKRGGQSGVRTVPYALAPGYRHSGPRKGSHYTRRPSTQLPYSPPPAARSVPKTGQKTRKTWKNSLFSGTICMTLPVPPRVETWGHRSASQTVTVVPGAMPARA